MMNKNYSVILRVWYILVIMVLSGCAEPARPPEVIFEQPVVTLITPEHRVIGRSVQERPIISTIIGNGRDTTLILATIHGNESAGTPLVLELSKYLRQNTHLLTGRRVVLVPIANPDGLVIRSRLNANGVDLNRNFATDNRINSQRFGQKALSEPEARAIEQLIREYEPRRIVSIHQPLACIDYDGPGSDLAQRMAEHCDLPVKKLGSRPGSLGSFAGLMLEIPIITFEMRQSDSSLDDDILWRRYGAALLSAITYPQTFTLE